MTTKSQNIEATDAYGSLPEDKVRRAQVSKITQVIKDSYWF